MNNEKEEAKLIKRIEMFEIFNEIGVSYLYDNKMLTSQELYDAIMEKYDDQKEDIEMEDIEDEDIEIEDIEDEDFEDEDIEDEVQLYMKIKKNREDYIDLVEDDDTYEELIDDLLKEDVSDINQAKKLVSFIYLYEKEILNQYIIDLISERKSLDVIKQLKNKCKEINPDYRETIKNYINNECIIEVSYSLEDSYYYNRKPYISFEIPYKRHIISFPHHAASYEELRKIGNNLNKIKNKDILEAYANIATLLIKINGEYDTKLDKNSKENLISSLVSICKQNIKCSNYNELSYGGYMIENDIDAIDNFLSYIDHNEKDSKNIFENIKKYIQNKNIKNLAFYLLTTIDKERAKEFISKIIHSKNFDFLAVDGEYMIEECDRYINDPLNFQRGKQEL